MKALLSICLALAGVTLLLASTNQSTRAENPGTAPKPADQAQALIEAYCVACHGDKTTKGDLKLNHFNVHQWNDHDLFEELVARVEDGDMPPADAKSPLTEEDRRKLLAVLTARLAELDASELPGKYRKLTASEYRDTLQDIFGETITDLSALPFDSDDEFKKIGERQVVTSYAVKKYYEVAERYLDEFLLDSPVKPRKVKFTSENGKDLVGRQYTTKQGALAGGGNSPNFILKSPVTSFAEEGEYELTFHWYAFYGPTKEPDKHERVEPINPPIIRYFTHADGEVLNPVQVWKSDRQVTCDMTKPIRIRLGRDMKFLTFRGPDREFKTFDKSDPRYVKVLESDLPKNEKRAALKALSQELMKELHGDKNMMLLVTGATFHGPLDKPEPEFNTRLFGDVKRTDPFDACKPILKQTAERLFRRPVPEETLDDYYAIAQAEYAESRNTYQAVKTTLNVMLCSPHFLFKHEGDEENLDDYMIASRLSYFLWNGPPDEELVKLAAAGRLRDPDVRRQQAERMIADREKSDRFSVNFTRQWLGLDKFGAFTPNEAYIRSVIFKQLEPHMAREPVEFFNEVLHNNLSAVNFIHSDFIVINNRLGPVYNHIPDIRVRRPKPDKNADPNAFHRMQVTGDTEMRRGGLITMPAIMNLTTDGENTQPILRGVWIAERMLGLTIEPPATVPAIEINLENVSKPRDILEKHKTDPSCYACHVKFDHFGLAMEHYDVIGRWKTDYVHPIQDDKGRFSLVKAGPIDANAELPDGEPMPGVRGVKEYLLENKQKVMNNLIEKLFSYALGREVRYRDRDQIKSLLKDMQANDYKLQDLLVELVASDGFTKR